MIIVRPVEVTDAVLTSSDVPENDAAEFSLISAYDFNELVMVTTDGVHSIFKSIIPGNNTNTGNQPEDDDPVTPVSWARVSATNRWAMFSDQISDQTEQADSIEVVLLPTSLVNAVSFFNVDANTIQVVMNDPIEGEVYNNTVTLSDLSGVNNPYEWYFEPISVQKTLSLIDLPPFINATITITITKTGSTAKLGLVSFGSQKRLGVTNVGLSSGIRDYSTKERDTFGNPVIVPRNFSKKANYVITIDTNSADTVQRILSELRTTPITFIGSVDLPHTILYGIYNDFSIISQITKSIFNLEVEALSE